MNKLILAIVATLLLVSYNPVETQAQCNEQLTNQCALEVGDNATYLKEFPAKLKRKRRNDPIPHAPFTVVLNKGTHYRFTLCNAVDYEGEGVLQLYDSNRLLGSTLDITTGKEYKSFDFMCQKTAVYQVFISFKEGKEGCAVGILSMVR